MTAQGGYGPAPWLRELARLKPARWPWGLSLRAAVAISAPLLVGLATGRMEQFLFVSLGCLVLSAGEAAGTYRSRFRVAVIAAPIGAAGFLTGYLGALPYPAVILMMGGLGFLSGIVSSYGAPFSIGAMQTLLIASLAIGLPEIAPFWQPAAFYLGGAVFYLLLLGLEALFAGRQPQRKMTEELLAALAALAATMAGLRDAEPSGRDTALRADGIEAARRRVTDASAALYAVLMETRRGGRTHEGLTLSATLDAADLVFSAILADSDPEALRAADRDLARMGEAATQGATRPVDVALDAARPLARRLRALSDALAAGRDVFALAPALAAAGGGEARRAGLVGRLTVGGDVLAEATALALCMGMAFASKYVVHESHWYWVPLTVALVMKPDFGSVFARSVLRAAGTSLGVVVGAAALILLPKGMALIAVVAALSAMLPWAKLVSYGVQAVVVTPLVLIMIDLIAPSVRTVDDGGQRLADTLIGGAIVLVFGYFLWPRSHARQLTERFAAALAQIADYLVAACAPLSADLSAASEARRRDVAARRSCYGALSNLRAALGRSMAEPPPAGREAAAWFPVVAGAERLCDRITMMAAARRPGAPGPDPAAVAAVAAWLRGITGPQREAPPPESDAFLGAVADDAAQLARLIRGASPPAAASGYTAGKEAGDRANRECAP